MKRPKAPSGPSTSPPPPRQPLSHTKQLRPISKKARNILQSPQSLPTSTIISLKQLEDDDVGYFLHFTEDEDKARIDLFDFLNMGVSLSELWKGFKGCDERFAQLAGFLEGARVLRQDPLECLIQFICSSNNNIQRITKMVDFISRKGKFLGWVEGFDFFEFPKLDSLVLVSETELREAGFGYSHTGRNISLTLWQLCNQNLVQEWNGLIRFVNWIFKAQLTVSLAYLGLVR